MFDVDAWNLRRRAAGRPKEDLRHLGNFSADLDGIDLAGCTLDGVSFSRCSLRGADLSGASLSRCNFSGADLAGATLEGVWAPNAMFIEANLVSTNLTFGMFSSSDFYKACLDDADLSDACLEDAQLSGASISRGLLDRTPLRLARLGDTDLTEARLRECDLTHATLSRTVLERTIVERCSVYGIAAWDLRVEGIEQACLRVSPGDQPELTVDSLEMAQFVYLLTSNRRLRDAIDTLTARTVLLLGRFTPERKAVLELLRIALRERNLIPIVFDFTGPGSRDTTSVVEILARISRFVIVDLSDPRSAPHELASIVPFLRSTPVQPLIEAQQTPYGMFVDLTVYPWVLPMVQYESPEGLLANLDASVIAPVERWLSARSGRMATNGI